MKCPRCSSEMPSHAQFCIRCGAPLSPGAPPPPFAARTASPWRPVAIISAIVILIVIAMVVGYAYRSNNRLTVAPGHAGSSGKLLAETASAGPTGPLISQPAQVTPPAPSPTDIIDYLKFLQKIEEQRRMLVRQQLGSALKDLVKAEELGATLSTRKYTQTFQQLNNDVNYNSASWQQLSREFMSYPKPVPPACQRLQAKYYTMLGKVAGSIMQISNALAQTQTDPNQSIDTLSNLLGDSSVHEAIVSANDELSHVCDKYHIDKFFSIRDDSGYNMFTQ